MFRIKRLGALIFTLLLCSSTITSQRTQIDSLYYLLETAETDLQRIDVLLALTRTHMLGEPPIEKGMDYAQEALALAQSIGNQAQEANSMVFVAIMKRNLAMNNQGDHEEARKIALASGDPNAIAFSFYHWVEEELYGSQEGIEMLEDILARLGPSMSQKNYGNVLKSLGWQYDLVGAFDKAEETNQKAIAIFRSMADHIEVSPKLGRPSAQIIDGGKENLNQTLVYTAKLFAKTGRFDEAISAGYEAYEIGKGLSLSAEAWTGMKLGSIYAKAGQYEKAIELFINSIDIYKEQPEPAWLSGALSELGSTFALVGDEEEAEKRYLEAYEVIKNHTQDRADLLMVFGEFYEKTQDFDKSILAYLEADSLYTALDKPLLRSACQLGIASSEYRQGYLEAATQRIQSQIPILEEVKDKDQLYSAYTRLGSIYLKEGMYNKSMTWAQKSLDLAKEDTLDYSSLKYSHSMLSTLYENLGDYKAGLYHHKKYSEYDEKQFLESATKTLKAEQVRQNVADYKEEKEKAVQIASILGRQNKTYLLVAVLLAGFLAIGSYLFVQLRKTRAALSLQNVQLQDLNHTKDRFFGIIAHDLRSPIIALESVDEQMSYYVKKGNQIKVQSLADMVGKTASNLNALLDNLLNWALVQTGNIPYKPETLNLYNITQDSVEILANNALVKEISIENKIPDQLIAHADEAALQTIIRNLLSNAIKFSSAGARVLLSANKQADEILVTIQDTGLGMSTKQQKSLYSLEKKSEKGTAGEKGTGLGLVLVKDLITLNKGTISIHSKVGEGTRVSFTVPSSGS